MKGSMTVEMAYIMPVVLLVFFFSVMGIFYYHDKNIISSCAYETAVVGSTKVREKKEMGTDILEAAFRERIRGKCILFPNVIAEISKTEQEVVVQASASKRGMRVAVRQSAKVTDPEKHIRDIRRIKIGS